MARSSTGTRRVPLTVIGVGSVGSRLAVALASAGYGPVTLVDRIPSRLRILGRSLKATTISRLLDLQQNQGIIVLCVPDNALPSVVRGLSRLRLNWRDLTVLHTAGVHGAEVLAPLAKRGAGVAAWHPYQTFPKSDREVTLRGITWGIDGNPRGVRTAFRLARELGGKPLRIRGKDRVLYHLSAVLACGFVAAELDLAARVLKTIGVPEKRALEAVLPIASETLLNVRALGTRRAMTGPALRGDIETLRRHLSELRRRSPELVSVYREVTTLLKKR
jgi:predicted short-subunit dehydrogenase-like oxidoreductase (DUF2520 family)